MIFSITKELQQYAGRTHTKRISDERTDSKVISLFESLHRSTKCGYLPYFIDHYYNFEILEVRALSMPVYSYWLKDKKSTFSILDTLVFYKVSNDMRPDEKIVIYNGDAKSVNYYNFMANIGHGIITSAMAGSDSGYIVVELVNYNANYISSIIHRIQKINPNIRIKTTTGKRLSIYYSDAMKTYFIIKELIREAYQLVSNENITK